MVVEIQTELLNAAEVLELDEQESQRMPLIPYQPEINVSDRLDIESVSNVVETA